MELAVAAFLVAHGAIHASFLSPRPAPKPGAPAWPFDLDHSWLLTPLGIRSRTLRPLGVAVVALTIACCILAALAVAGVLPGELVIPTVTAAAVASLATLTVFFHLWLGLGILIDAVMLWLAWSSPTVLA